MMFKWCLYGYYKVCHRDLSFKVSSKFFDDEVSYIGLDRTFHELHAGIVPFSSKFWPKHFTWKHCLHPHMNISKRRNESDTEKNLPGVLTRKSIFLITAKG